MGGRSISISSPNPLPDERRKTNVACVAAELYWGEGWLALYRALEAHLSLAALDHALPPRWIDAGCGEGRFAELLSRAADTYHPAIGLDSDAARMMKCHREDLFSERHAADLAAIPVRSGSVDAILCNSVLEHCEDPGAILAEFNRVLAVGGRLVLTLPSRRFEDFLAGTLLFRAIGLRRLAGRYARWMSNHIQHRHYWTESEIRLALEGAGFAVDRLDGFASRRFSALGDIMHLMRMAGIGGSRFSRLTPEELARRPILRAIRKTCISVERAEVRREFRRGFGDGEKRGMLMVAGTKTNALV
jgi:ubiquinone/menaquinone biosynthesis C-methylase UbiE